MGVHRGHIRNLRRKVADGEFGCGGQRGDPGGGTVATAPDPRASAVRRISAAARPTFCTASARTT